MRSRSKDSRLDLDEWRCTLAREIGAKPVLSTGAHDTGEVGFMRYAVDQARRGRLEAHAIPNTRNLQVFRTVCRRP